MAPSDGTGANRSLTAAAEAASTTADEGVPMSINLNLTKREAEAVLRARLSVGHGVRRSKALEVAEFKLRQAIIADLKLRDVGEAA
jgi:hypothetical protein